MLRDVLNTTRLACIASVFLFAALASGLRADQITVFAAASLKTALDDIARDFQRASGYSIALSAAGSSVLARQIALGAPADIFISANVTWMDRLQRDGAIALDTRFDLLGNRLALIAHDPDAQMVQMTSDLPLAKMLGDARLAMALVDAVPAGIYGKAALTSLGLWSDVAPKVAQTDNVRAALALVALGEVPYGIVYKTDALAEPRVHTVGIFPAETHPPIVYPVAAVRDGTSAPVDAFLRYLRGGAARQTFERHGFTVIAR